MVSETAMRTLNLASTAMADPGRKYVPPAPGKGELERKSHLKHASAAAVTAEPGRCIFQVRWRGRRSGGAGWPGSAQQHLNQMFPGCFSRSIMSWSLLYRVPFRLFPSHRLFCLAKTLEMECLPSPVNRRHNVGYCVRMHLQERKS